jgi:antitoxin MazE
MYIQKGVFIMEISLKPWGNSQGIRIPKELLSQLSWDKNEVVDVKVEDNKIIIKKASKKMSLKERYEEFYGCPYDEIDFYGEVEEEYDWDQPVGEEIL